MQHVKVQRRDDSPSALNVDSSMTSSAVPFSPKVIATLSPLGYFVTGYPNRYAFELQVPGAPVRSVRREVPPQTVSSTERVAERNRVEESMRRNNPSWSWSGPDIPRTKPLYSDLFVGLDGRIWVALAPEMSARIGTINGGRPMGAGRPGAAPPPSIPPPSTSQTKDGPALYDVFEPDGVYLGQVQVPPRVSTVVRRGDHVWAVAFGEDDVASVKRYRIVWK